jgi:phosphatidylglycerophosphatase A
MPPPTESRNPNNAPKENSAVGAPAVGFLTKAFASGLFSGYSPIASGTVGSAVGLAFYFIPGFEGTYVMIPLCAIVFFMGIRTAEAMERVYGQDPSEVTIDEVLGMWVSLLFLPKTLVIAVLAFLLFRILDIVKPYPAKRFDNTPGGFGVMMDDVISGIYANLLLQLAVALKIF